jgi:hypothetical protein
MLPVHGTSAEHGFQCRETERGASAVIPSRAWLSGQWILVEHGWKCCEPQHGIVGSAMNHGSAWLSVQ